MILDQLVRTNILIGEANLAKLARKHVVVAGVGGVGGYVVEALVRAGIGQLTIIDHDVIDPSNLNRQLITNLSNVGAAKVSEFKQRILTINPSLKLNALQEFISADNLEQLVGTTPDYVIDCIDTIDSKLALLNYCYRQGIKVVASMGAGNRIDVTKVKVSDISKTKVCALARNLRLGLRKLGIHKGIKVVYSEEVPFNKPQIASGGGRPVNGTISYLPALFGIMLSGIVLQDLIIND